jgi:hypothetical protein
VSDTASEAFTSIQSEERMSKRDKASKKGSKKEKKAGARAAAGPSPRTLTEQKASLLVNNEDGSPLYVVRNVLLTTQCPDMYEEGSLALFGTYTVAQPKS